MHRTEIEGPFLAAKGLKTNSVQFLPPNHVTISNVCICSFTCMISHVRGHACKTILRAQNLVYEKLLIYEGLKVSCRKKGNHRIQSYQCLTSAPALVDATCGKF